MVGRHILVDVRWGVHLLNFFMMVIILAIIVMIKIGDNLDAVLQRCDGLFYYRSFSFLGR